MKKCFLLLFVLTITVFFVHAQNIKYVLFTSTEGGTYGVSKDYQPLDNDLNSCVYFSIFNNIPSDYGAMFVHENEKGQPNQPVITTKPLSFLNTISYDDLDPLQPMSREQIKAKYKEYETYDKLYFIDRRDFTPTTLTVIEVLPISKTGARY